MGTPAKKPASKAKKKTKRCKFCNTPRWLGPKDRYCDETCRKAAEVKKRPSVDRTEKKQAQFQSTTFGKYLIRECIRAGTVQILGDGLTKHNRHSLAELYELWKACKEADGYGSRTYELSHIASVAAGITVGCLVPENLVIATQLHNRRHGNQTFGHGVSIPRSSLSPEWEVIHGMTEREVMALIMDYIGEEECQRFRIDNKLPTFNEASLLHQVKSHPKYCGENLEGASPQKLRMMLDDYNGKKGFTISKAITAVDEVIQMELSRHSAFRPALTEALEWYSAYIEHRYREYGHWQRPKQIEISAEFDAVVTQHLFDVLMGKAFDPESLAPALHQQCCWIQTRRHLLDNVFTDYCVKHLGPAPARAWDCDKYEF